MPIVAQGHDPQGWDTETITNYDDATYYINRQKNIGTGLVTIYKDGQIAADHIDPKTEEGREFFLFVIEALIEASE